MKKILVSLALTALSAAGVMAAEAPWKLDEWRKVPEVFPVDPASFEFNVPENVTPLYYTGADYQGRETRVFAWMGVPEVPEGETVPAMYLSTAAAVPPSLNGSHTGTGGAMPQLPWIR